ncbi:hypothetical protein JJB07_06425 [Tumebacillus sp. ITR2]|uniref:Uncharacterized protein n=1 Tax=Tumebacillus amylolyticus TaxID=2801339 RepID=A0ABS1J7P6_9BACL|nr:hypothetical protein [Tumebacillus amylolyticus]MBL0386288.1 hypothetical protein [Tumebacillus amylolyticus]
MKRGDGVTFRRKRLGRVLLFAYEWTQSAEDVALEFARTGRNVHVITCVRSLSQSWRGIGSLYLHQVELPDQELLTPRQSEAVLNIWLAAMGSRVLTAYGRFELLVAQDEEVAEAVAMLAQKASLPICVPSEALRQRLLSPMEVNG